MRGEKMRFRKLNSRKGGRDDSRIWARMKEAAPLALGALALAGSIAVACGGRSQLRVDDMTTAAGGPAGSTATGGGGEGGTVTTGGAGGEAGTGGIPFTGVPVNLIGDHLNRQLQDREGNTDPSDPDQAYQIGGSDTSEHANPFTDSNGGNLGISKEFMYKVDDVPEIGLVDMTVTDSDSGHQYTETQAVWMQGDNHFEKNSDDVVGRLDFIAYSLKFDGPDAEVMGIPVCTDAVDDDFSACKGPGGDMDVATETHRVKVHFLGEEWTVLRMDAPAGTLDNENGLVNGGSVMLGKESVGGILNEGEYLQVNDLKFRLEQVDYSGGTAHAIIAVLDANDNVLEMDSIGVSETKEIVIQGTTYVFHVFKLAPEYTSGAKWADISMLASMLEFEDGQSLDSDNGTNPNWEVTLGWKNRDASIVSTKPDTLRTIIVWADDIEDISTSYSEELEAGDYLDMVTEPALWRLNYHGLDITSQERTDVRFQLKTTEKVITESKGPIVDGSQAHCTIHAPYLEVGSSESGSVFNIGREDAAGTLGDDEFLVTLAKGAYCSNAQGALSLDAGTVFMKISPSSDDYGLGSRTVDFKEGGVTITFESTGDISNPWPSIGALLRSAGSDCGVGSNCSDVLGVAPNTPDMLIQISEKAGEGQSSEYKNHFIFGVDGSGIPPATYVTFDFDYQDSTGFPITSDAEEVLYGHATPSDYSVPSGPVTRGMEFVKEGYISERGSVFERIDDKEVEFSLAHKVVKAVWGLTKNQ